MNTLIRSTLVHLRTFTATKAGQKAYVQVHTTSQKAFISGLMGSASVSQTQDHLYLSLETFECSLILSLTYNTVHNCIVVEFPDYSNTNPSFEREKENQTYSTYSVQAVAIILRAHTATRHVSGAPSCGLKLLGLRPFVFLCLCVTLRILHFYLYVVGNLRCSADMPRYILCMMALTNGRALGWAKYVRHGIETEGRNHVYVTWNSRADVYLSVQSRDGLIVFSSVTWPEIHPFPPFSRS